MYKIGRKKLNKSFSCNSCCLAVIIRLLFNPHDALWLWHRRKWFVIVAYFKMASQRDSRVKVYALLRAGHKISQVVRRAGSSRNSKDCWGSWELARCHSRDCFEWHPASCHNPQQLFNHCLYVCWHLSQHNQQHDLTRRKHQLKTKFMYFCCIILISKNTKYVV